MIKLNSSTSNSSRKIVVYITASIVSTYSLLLIIDFLWSQNVVFHKDWFGTSIVKRAIENMDPNEIPIFGSSMAQRSYMPEILGEHFYNYGRAGSNYQKIYPLVEAELRKQRDTPVIIDFYSNFLNYKEDYEIRVRDFLPMTNEPLVEELLHDFHAYSPAFKVEGVRYFGFFTDYWIDLKRLNKAKAFNYFNKGGAFYLPQTPQREFEEFVRKRKKTYNPFTVNPSLEKRFLKALASRPDRKIILVMSPSHKSAYGTEIQYEEMVAYLAHLEKEFSNVIVLSFNGSDYPDDHFKDTLHPNIKGAKKFSLALKNALFELLS